MIWVIERQRLVLICVRGNDRVRGYTMCTTHSTGDLLKATHVFFCQEPTVLNCLRISHTLINFCQLCHILGVCLPIIRAILTILVTLSERLKEILSGYCKIGFGVPLFVNIWTVVTHWLTVLHCDETLLETRRSCFTLSGRLKEATEDWVQRGNWTEIARLSQSCTRGQCSSINGEKNKGQSQWSKNMHTVLIIYNISIHDCAHDLIALLL